MFIVDFEDTVTVFSADGRRHAAVLKGLVEPDSPGTAGLGHSPLALADQAWRDLTLHTGEALEFKTGQLLFRDGSRCDAELTLKRGDGARGDTPYVYGVVLRRPGR